MEFYEGTAGIMLILELFWIIISIDELVYANKIYKFAFNFGFEVKQERLIAITDKAIYNIKREKKGGKMQRKIEIKDIVGLIKCVQPSNNVTEFTILVENSYDYRYSTDW